MRRLLQALLAMTTMIVSAPALSASDPRLAQYSDIMTRLGNEAYACTPETWNKGVLTIQSDGMRLTYQLKNDASSDRASISEQLRTDIDELYIRMRQNGDTWTAARFEFQKVGDRVDVSWSFTYD